MTDRRGMLQDCAGFMAFALLSELAAAGAAATGVSARRWVSLQRDLARGLRDGSVTQLQWHAGVNALARELDLEQLAGEFRRVRIKAASAPLP